MNFTQRTEQPSKKRIVLVTVIMAVIVLGLLAAVIAVAANRQKVATPEVEPTVESSQSEGANSEDSIIGEASDTNVKPVENNQQTSTYKREVKEEKTDLPATGPTEIIEFLPLVLLAVAISAYGVSRVENRECRASHSLGQ